MLDVTQVLDLRHRLEAAGAARVARDEDGLAVARAFGAPLEVVGLGVRRLAILPGAQDREVEAEAREGEVVRVAAELGDLVVRDRDEADVVVDAVGVELVVAALVERLDLVVERVRGFFGRGEDRSLVLGEFRGDLVLGHLVGEALVHLRRDVIGRDELLDRQLRDADLVFEARRLPTGGQPVLAGRRHGDDVLTRTVVVREDQAARADERRRATTAVAEAREAQVVEPLLGRTEAVLGLEEVERSVLVRPHAAQFLVFLGRQRRSKESGRGGDRQSGRQQEVSMHGWIGRAGGSPGRFADRGGAFGPKSSAEDRWIRTGGSTGLREPRSGCEDRRRLQSGCGRPQ